MPPGTMIMLNGGSSAGKSSIIAALQDILDGPYLHAGLDTFCKMLPPRYLWGAEWAEVFGPASHAGPVGRMLVSGMHHALAGLVLAGSNVLVDHVLLEAEWAAECGRLFADLPAYLIAVRCALQVAEQREQQRRDRAPGQARAHFERVHAHGLPDFTVDTTSTDASTCAQAIKHYLQSGAPPRAFLQLRDRS